ncbi:phospholipase D-like domain-containing protein [Achromobacter insuavis]|uniref:phospholipase D-like domain-containing protein n=1 Tax=Achromobacter insuavis TaxID=1287735 RepID=UPI001F12CB57
MIIQQLQTCQRAWIAVAWATENEVFYELLKQERKLEVVVIGTHGSLTAPSCIERLATCNWVSFRSAKGPLFHPKLYLFEHGDRYTAIVGSHNMTRGAFQNNIELSTASEFEKNDPTVLALRQFVEQSAKGPCITPTAAFISHYRASHRAAQSQRKTIDELYQAEPDRMEEKVRTDAPIHMEWDDWLAKVNAAPNNGCSRRLDMLDQVQTLLRQPGGFLKLSIEDRKRIAGTTTARPKQADDIDWHFFGAMTSAHRFGHSYAHLIEKENPIEVASALDLIPAEFPPTRENWLEYWAALERAAGDEGGIGIVGATRLACLKRPDYFVPISSTNVTRLSEQLGVPKEALKDARDYWDTVVETILLTPWWNEERPAGLEQARLWRARSAMLDAIVYAGNSV